MASGDIYGLVRTDGACIPHDTRHGNSDLRRSLRRGRAEAFIHLAILNRHLDPIEAFTAVHGAG